MDSGYYRPVIPLLFAYAAGIVAGCLMPGWRTGAIVLLAAGLCFLVYNIHTGRSSMLLPYGVFVFLGYIAIGQWCAPVFPENHIIHYTGSRAMEITGTLAKPPVIRNHRIQGYLDVTTLAWAGKAPFPVCGRIRLTIQGQLPELRQGDTLQFRSKIRSIRNFSNPGGYNYQLHMAFNGIRGSAYATAEKIIRTGQTGPTDLSHGRSFRSRVAEMMAKSASPEAAGILKALIMGDKSGIPTDIREDINRAGLGHLLAISGLHIGIVATFFFFLFQKLLAWWPWLVRHGRVKTAAALLTIIPVVGYGGFAGMSPSTQRAVIMVCAFMATFVIKREQDLFNTLAVAAFIILVVFPPALFKASFQLSFAAVWAIVAGMRRLPDFSGQDQSFPIRAGCALMGFVAVSLFATIGTLPLVMYYFNQVSLIGWLSNLAGIPLVGFLAVPLGLVSTALVVVCPLLAKTGFWVCGMVIDAALFIILFMGHLDFAAVTTFIPNYLEMAGFYILLAGTLSVPKSRWKLPVLLITCLVLAVDAGYWVHRRHFAKTLRVTVFDVGQGFGSLVELPRGETMMVDGGGFSNNTIFDVGARIIAPYLRQHKILTVDRVVASHANTDHFNGLTHILGHFNVKTVWTNGQAADTAAYDAFAQAVSTAHVRAPEFCDIPRQIAQNGVTIELLHPEKEFQPDSADQNDSSIVVRLSFGNFSILFPGDITATAEQKLVRHRGRRLESTVLIAPHHGSRTSGSLTFLNCVSPETIIIPVGYNNRFHFPHPAVMARFKKTAKYILRTDFHGAIEIHTDGHRITISATLDPESE